MHVKSPETMFRILWLYTEKLFDAIKEERNHGKKMFRKWRKLKEKVVGIKCRVISKIDILWEF